MSMMGNFYNYDLSEHLSKQRQAAVRLLKSLDDELFVDDPESVVDDVYQQYCYDDLIVHTDRLVVEKFGRAQIPAFDAYDRVPYETEGIAVEFSVPLEGPNLWRYKAMQSYSSGALMHLTRIEDGVAHFRFTGSDVTAARSEPAVRTEVGQLQQVAEWANTDLNTHNIQLRQLLLAVAQRRNEQIEKVEAERSAFTIPLRTSPGAKIPIPVKPRPVRPQSTRPRMGRDSTRSESADYYLEMQVYDDVVQTIVNTSRGMEKTPTAGKFHEEELRNMFLIVLNANYVGNVQGEAFNGRGKTDILLTWNGGNAFIGECKIWGGPKALTEAIDQLLGYVTWRDTKAALVIFYPPKNATEKIEKAHATIEAHTSHVKTQQGDGDSVRRYVLASPEDAQRKIQLALVPVILPGVEADNDESRVE